MPIARLRVTVFGGLLLLGFSGASVIFAGPIYTFESDPLGSVPTWPAKNPDGWYTATVAGSVPASVYAYAGFPPAANNPRGGAQVLGLIGTPSGQATRAQHDIDFSPAGQWSVSYDVFVGNTNSPSTTYGSSYIGSFSIFTISPGSPAFTVLDAWDSSAANSSWTLSYVAYDSSGVSLSPTGAVPGPAWTGLSQAHWYNELTVFDTTSNRILSLSITDLTTNSITTVTPNGWYMGGGAGATFQANAIRLTGFQPSNAILADNVNLAASPEPATFVLMGAGLIALFMFRRPASSRRGS